MRQLASHWATDYDWRVVESRLQALPQFITEIDGVDIHFIHVRSQHDGTLPVVVTHGWPGSIIEQLKIIGPLTDPEAHGGSAEDAFDVVIPSLPGHGYLGQADHDRLGSDPHRARLGRPDGAARLRPVRGPGRRLGQRRHRTDGAAATDGAARHPHEHAGHDPRGHRDGAPVRQPAAARPLRRGAVRVGSARLLLQARPRVRAGDGEPPADAVRARGFAGRSCRLDARPRRGQPGADRARLRRRSPKV